MAGKKRDTLDIYFPQLSDILNWLCKRRHKFCV